MPAPRTVLTPQILNQIAGSGITFSPIDIVNGMQVPNNGRTAILVQTPIAGGAAILFKSVPCSHGRSGDINTSLGASLIEEFGPFTDPSNWGDGKGTLFIDFQVITGSVSIAAVTF